jgi:DNA processing protein
MTSSDPPPALSGDQRVALLTLALIPGIGPERLRSLLAACGSPGGALAAPFAFLRSIPGITAACATAITRATPRPARQVIQKVGELGGVILLQGDGDYPAALDALEDPPPALFALGRPELLRRPAVAIVGSRDHSSYGGQVAAMIAGQAGAAGLVVVSGMARGLDAVAQQAALDAGGATIGVLGNGLGVIYPAANRHLYQQVSSRGLLVTEFPPGERPTAGSFPRRNRIISGLARATVVVEAAAGSGALITAGAALEQGRDVFAVPGPITSRVSAGTNLLIRDGAHPLLEMADLFARYPELAARPDQAREDGPVPLPQSRVLALLRSGPRQADELGRRLGLSGADLLALLGNLEIAGLVRQDAGLQFSLANPGFAAARAPTP